MGDPLRGAEPAREKVILAPDLFTRPDDPRQEPMLLGSGCPTCREVYFPPRKVCPRCFEEEPPEVKEICGRGRIYASTVVRIPAPVGIRAPYAYGYVELAESRLRVFALFSGAEPEWFVPGREVELTVETIRVDESGREVVGYKFRPAGKGQG